MSEKQYPPLPTAYDVQYDEIDGEDVRCYSEQQMRAYVDADRAQRAPLTIKQIRGIARDAQIAYCLNKYDSFDMALIRAVEEAHGIHERKESGDV